MPVLTIFAGPNGSGKSSITERVEFEGRENLLEPDAIARRVDPSLPQRAAISAGREVLERTAEYVRRCESFAIETTLSGSWTTSAIRSARDAGFRILLYYVCLNSQERNIQRVQERVIRGGHDVPEEDVRRRYARSLANAKKLLLLVDHALVFDNSGPEPALIFEIRASTIVRTSTDIPAWAATLLNS